MADSRFDLPTVYALLISKVQEIITTVKNSGVSPSIEYMAWDARQEVTELPNNDLIGVADWTYSESDDHLPEIEFAILLSVIRDVNLFREVEILDAIRKACVHPSRPEYLVWTVKDANNEAFAQVQVTDFTVMPSGESEARTTRMVGISLKRADYAK